jgi:hypothetical protein
LDRAKVGGISSALATRSRITGNARRLIANRERCFMGSNLLGTGFVLSPEEAQAMIAVDPRNADVLKPFLVGQDLNRQPGGSPTRWVIDFRDWPVDRARSYPEPFARVEELVRPERLRQNERRARDYWWRFLRSGAELYRAITPLQRCVAIARVSSVVQPMLVPTKQVVSEQVVVFAYDDDGHFGVLSSGFHWWWAVTHASTLETRIRYTGTDCFETFVQPDITPAVSELGRELHVHRRFLMLDSQAGLTQTYNRVHDREQQADDIVHLRELHIALDLAVRDAYGWRDLDLGHGFHDTKLGTRFTFAPVPRQEVLDRLLELNHERYAEEVRQGSHAKGKAKRKTAPAGAMTLGGFDDV